MSLRGSAGPAAGRRGTARWPARWTGSWWSPSCWPATRSAIRRAGRCTSTGRPGDGRRARAVPSVYVIQGYHRPGGHVAVAQRVRADARRAPRRHVRGRRLPRRGDRVRRRLDLAGRVAVPQLVEHRSATWTTCATRSSRSSTQRYPTLAEREHRGIAGQVVGRLRRDGGADAAPRRVRRAGLARRRRPVRGLLPARTSRSSRASSATTSTARCEVLLERLAEEPTFNWGTLRRRHLDVRLRVRLHARPRVGPASRCSRSTSPPGA